VALNFAGIGRTPQFAIGTSLSCVGSFAATQRKSSSTEAGQLRGWNPLKERCHMTGARVVSA
jgi:hypothetical protein